MSPASQKPVSVSRKTYAETLKLARLGSREAQYEVGLMCANGLGTAKDLEKAIEWVSQAAQKGLPAAQYLLGTRYAAGIVVQQDLRRALWWFQNAAEQGHIKAQLKVGQLLSQGHPEVGIRSIRLAAEQGLAEAQFALGQALATGQGTEKNLDEAVDWYRQASLQGIPAAQCALAELYETGLGVEVDIDQAWTLYRKAAGQLYPKAQVALESLSEQGGRQKRQRKRPSSAERRQDGDRWLRVAEAGDADAKYWVGLLCERGLGVEKDPDQARSLYRAAARQGHSRAQLALAQMLEEDDPVSAEDWFVKAATGGHAEAIYALGQRYASTWDAAARCQSIARLAQAAQNGLVEAQLDMVRRLEKPDGKVSADFLELAAQQGLPEAQYQLGCRFAMLRHDAQAMENAVFWWQKAALAGNVDGASDLGAALLDGNGITRNPGLALRWVQLAADAGHAKAQWNLGGMYVTGAGGLQQDIKQAFVWCHRSADQGFVPAQATLGVLYELIGKYDKSVHWLRQAADAGDPEAQFNLAMMYRSGKGVQMSKESAFEYFCAAAEQGVSSAQLRLALAYGTGDGVMEDGIEAHKWLLIARASGAALAEVNLKHSTASLNQASHKEANRRAQKWLQQAAAGRVA